MRDASLTLEALWVAACPDEAQKFFNFLTRTATTQIRRGAELQIMYGVAGEYALHEHNMDHLSGWRGSRPVRVGNAAWKQRQLDVYGELMAAVHRLRDYLEDMGAPSREFLIRVADAAADRWKQKDRGIWEIRGPERHFLHSKLMCWTALDRALDLVDILDAEDRISSWRNARKEVRMAILKQGWSDEAGYFRQAFDNDELDASSLMIPIVGFLDGDDPRVRSTVEAVGDHLTSENGLVFRYRNADHLGGREGAFLLCTFWYAHALALTGEVEQAREVLTSTSRFANDLGLMAEEVDPHTGDLLGNFPQAFSHIGLINAAWAIAEASGKNAGGDRPAAG
ncbi:MAG: glycoside hydrolase family 15 protein [Rhodothermales bacterium]